MWDSPEVVPVIDGFEAVPRVPANSIYHNKSQRAAVDNGKLGERGGRNLECEFVIHMQPRRYMLTWWSMGRDLTGGWIWVHVGAARTLPLEGCGLFAGGGSPNCHTTTIDERVGIHGWQVVGTSTATAQLVCVFS